ncbi:MipA/OmpV family protein [Cronobacter muytjensii]|nr:MipA/OmpV family protein [Cronobacter muytjensii]
MEIKFLFTKSLWALVLFAGAASASGEQEVISTVGLGYGSAMKYSGSDERTSSAVPYFNIQYGPYFIDSSEGIGFKLTWGEGFYYTQSVGYSSGRADKDSDTRDGSDKLRGMGKIKEAGVSSSTIGWNFGDSFVIEGNVTAPFTDSQGVSYRAGVKYSLWSDDKDTLVISTNANFGDARYNNTFYGISRKQSERTGFNKYRAGSGLYSVDAGLSWSHVFSDNWWTYAEATYAHLDKNVNRSDIVFKNEQTEFLVGLFYSF